MSSLIYLKTDPASSGLPITVGRTRLQRLAKHWHYVMRSRRRWITDPELRDALQARATSHLGAIGVGPKELQKIAQYEVVQVEIDPPSSLMQAETDGWESRLIPWEYLLSAATRKYREGRLHVVRYLRCGRAMMQDPPAVPTQMQGLFVESAPGRLRGKYNFSIEREVLERHLEGRLKWTPLPNPSITGIQSATATSPDVIHVTGLDTFQGARFLDRDQKIPANSIKDGMYLRNDSWDETAVDSATLALALSAGITKPRIVSFNLYNSSARTAAFAVAQGAAAAIGFQDYIDDMLAEVFYANFYWQWRNSGCDLLAGFKGGMNAVLEYSDRLQGAGIVLWSAQSLIGMKPSSPVPVATQPISVALPPSSSWIRVETKPVRELNYSILQNSKRPLFDQFSIYKLRADSIRDLEVVVELQIGNERYPYRRMLEMKHHVHDLSEEIGVGLTSDLARSLTESVQTTLYVRVEHKKDLILSATQHVTLLPVDQWCDDDTNRIWLPSFVLPRDPAVLQIITHAQRYLMALADDAGAGFDGYQSVEENPDDFESVDSQVRALWCALLHEYGLSYINPPPVFTLASQRLRAPSQVVDGRRGTCIDLALLMAASLEFVDIKPVLFLLQGHAFPGYWTSEEARHRFLVRPNPLPLMEAEGNMTPLPDEEQEQEATESFAQRVPWEVDNSRYEEVIEAVNTGDLVPLETTLLTNHGSFHDAIEQGRRNLEDPEQFEYMMDIGVARDSDVTPLPLDMVKR